MKIADYGKAITSYIESPTKVEKDKLKLQAGLLEEYLGDDLEYQRAVDDGFQGTKEDYYRYKSTSEEDRTFLAEGTPPPKKPRQLKDLFERINRAVLAVSSNTIAPEFIVPELETLTQEYISDGLISGEDARKFAIERKDYWDKWISENPGGTTPTFDFDNEGKATEVSQEEIIKRVNEADGGIIKGKNLGSREGFAAPALAVPAFNIARTAAMPLIRKGAEIIGGTALGKRLSDTFLSKDGGDDKKEIIPSDDKGSNIEPPEDPIGDAISAVELATTANDIKKIIEEFRAQKTSPGSSQPKMSNLEKSELMKLVVNKFKEDQNRMPSFTELKNFLPKFPNLKEVIDYSQIELSKQKADYDRSDPGYVTTMENKAQDKAIKENTISIFKEKNFFPETVTLPNGDVVDAKTFFEENFAKRVELGPGREEAKALTLSNKELAKIFNTNIRKIEKATKIIKDSPDFKAEYPPVRPANYGNIVALERLKEARKYLTDSELTNIKSQEQQLNNLNTMFKTGELVVTDFPNLVKAINTTLDKETGKLDFSIKKTAKQMIERSKNNAGLFDISHTIPKTSEQKNIEFLRNRNILDYKTNQGLFKSFEAYVKNQKDDPEYDLRLDEFDKYMKEMGQRVKIGNRFFGLDEKMFDSNTGEHTGINRALEYFGLPKFEDGVPLKTKKAEGGSVYGKYAEQIAKLP